MRIVTLALLVLMVALPATSLFPKAPQSHDVPAEVDSAERALQGARNDLEHAGGQWGGHRVAAKHIDEALRELKEAEMYAREHHDIR